MPDGYDVKKIEDELDARGTRRANVRDEGRRQSLALEQIADELYRIRHLLAHRNEKLR